VGLVGVGGLGVVADFFGRIIAIGLKRYKKKQRHASSRCFR
jgi:hypothetical protein